MRPKKTPAPPAGTGTLRESKCVVRIWVIVMGCAWTMRKTFKNLFGRYQHPVVMDGFHNNPEVVITSQKPPNHVIKGQITSLKNTIEMLNSAYRGFDPHLVDNGAQPF